MWSNLTTRAGGANVGDELRGKTAGEELPGGVPVLIALGANIGDPARQLEEARTALATLVQVEQVSPIYRTAPVGIVNQPDFLNQVLAGRTSATVFGLHRAVHEIERSLGRERGERNGPRLIDIDLLAYGELVVESADLHLPHPRLHERSFVLLPLLDVAPDWRHPKLRAAAQEMLDEIASPSEAHRL